LFSLVLGVVLKGFRMSFFAPTHWLRAIVFLGSLSVVLAACVATPGSETPKPSQIEGAAGVTPAIASKYASKGPFEVSIASDVWQEDTRGRAIDVKLYVPDVDVPPPVVVFSHGLGGSVEAASYLGLRLASWGVLSIHIQHPGSDREVWRGVQGRQAIRRKLGQAARDPQTSIDRFNDLPFVLDQIAARAGDGRLNGDPGRIGMAGHSFGAHSVLAAMGRVYRLGSETVSFKDDRLKAGLVLSPPAPERRIRPKQYSEIYGAIDRPLLHVTGTEDLSPLDRTRPASDRQIPFRTIALAPQYLVVFDRADHAVFGGRNRPGSPADYPVIQTRVAEIGTLFFYAYLIGDEDALAYLNGGAFLADFSIDAQAERRLVNQGQE